MKQPRSRRRGATLMEILISLGIVLVGMLALFRTLGTAVTGSMTASRFSQAQQRAVLIMENLAAAAALDSSVYSCLVNNAASAWAGCETICQTVTGSSATADSCTYITLSPSGTVGLKDQSDANNQNYFLVTSGGNNSTQATVAGSGRLFEFQVAVGWRDDNATSGTPDHSVVLRSGFFQ